ncbi:hypothetical protein AWM75_02125 [Aerococcus urinaehominis]|uniref:Bifunctional protein FolD n=1 Tax=Aerococcus urinaehominis TaxID=128944 RepID=A0A0X8FNR7_9LACT|nr:hypothetical protein AWM75_02125 [Aerococcus urinaehominis]
MIHLSPLSIYNGGSKVVVEMRSKDLVSRIKTDLASQAQAFRERGIRPHLVTILVGNDAASISYAKSKQKLADQIGAQFSLKLFPSITTTELLQEIDNLNEDPSVHGIMLELPLPKTLDQHAIVSRINPKKDVDALNPVHLGNLLAGQASKIPNTALASMTLMAEYGIDLVGKQAVMVGRSLIVGKPLAELMSQAGATVTVCHSQTKDLANYTRQADIICVAIGRPGYITGDMVKEGAVLVDIGTNYDQNGKLVGDAAYSELKDKLSAITPVPGGVGPLTNLMLFKQLYDQIDKDLGYGSR